MVPTSKLYLVSQIAFQPQLSNRNLYNHRHIQTKIGGGMSLQSGNLKFGMKTLRYVGYH